MGEYATLAKLIAVLVVINAAAAWLLQASMKPGGPITADYHAVLQSNGVLEETYTYHVEVSHEYHMLYRYWKAHLAVHGAPAPAGPYIELLRIACPKGFIPYVKDYRGVVYTSRSGTAYTSYIAGKAYYNEAGCFNPNGIPRGTYTIKITYLLHPPVEVDGKGLARLELKLADKHIPYSSVHVEIKGFKVLRLYVHTPFYSVERRGEEITIDTYSLKDMLLELDMLYDASSSTMPIGVLHRVGDLPELFERENQPYLQAYNAIKTLFYSLYALVLAFPVIVVLIYLKWGREKSYVVPRYLSYVPNRERKPWEVNLLFKGDALEMDHDAFYATILDLARRGVVRIRDKGDDVEVVLPEKTPENLDFYERDVLEFLREWSDGGVFSFKRAEEKIREAARDRSEAIRIRAEMSQLLRTHPRAKEYAKRFVYTFKWWFAAAAVLVLVAILAYIFAPIRLPGMKPGESLMESGAYLPYAPGVAGCMAAIFVDLLACSLTPSQLFGRWRDDYYREKLMWDSFRRMLSDLAMIEKYRPADLSMWQEWLVYGTALGVGKKVAEAMKKLGVPPVPGVGVVYVGPATIGHAYAYVSRAASSGGGGGGGFGGVGGGFGGGGAGAR